MVNTVGWSATADAADNRVYEDTNDTLINDPEICKRLMDLNPKSFRQMVTTLLEVNGRGYWETSDENIEWIQATYQEFKNDRLLEHQF